MALYALPKVGRAGLGNQLFPWARAEVFAHRTSARVLEPRWNEFHLGPYLRGEAEKRRYAGFFRASQHVRGGRRALVSVLGRRLPELAGDRLPCGRRPLVVEFNGINDLFTPLLPAFAFVREQLWSMTRPAHRPEGTEYGGPFVALHVRRGDLTRQGFTSAELEGVRQFTPTSWFVAMARAVGAEPLLSGLPLVVFTDGDESELSELIAMPGVTFHKRRSALADLWLLSRATVLFASGYSTFSMWASYLGGMPTIYAPGKIQQRVQVGRDTAIELELPAGESLPRQVLEAVTKTKPVPA